MADITIENAKDLGKITLASFKRDKFEVVFNHNDYPIVAKLYRGRGIEEQTGKVVTRSITLGTTGNAKHSGIYEERDQHVTNIQEEIVAPWIHADTSFSYAVQEVMAQGRGKGFVKLIKVRRTNMMNELADLLEKRGLSCPDGPADKDNPNGIPYWICRAPASLTGDDRIGWTGKNPNYENGAEITEGAGRISSSSYPKWANWYAPYQGIDDNLLKRLDQAFRRTKFRSPATVADIKSNDFGNFTLWTNDAVLMELNNLALKSDDAVGYDLGKYAGRTAFKRLAFEYHDILDTHNTHTYGKNPIFGVNWDHIFPILLTGDRFRVSEPTSDRRQHNVLTVFVDVSYNYLCDNRQRAGFLLSQE